MITYSRPFPSQLTMVSFSQNREDVLIDRVFRKKGGFFIDIGASHPVDESITKYFNLGGWRGINIEPDPKFFPDILRDRPGDINLPCAVGRTRGMATFYSLPHSSMSTLCTAQLDLLHPVIREGEKSIQVEVRTLADICAEFVTGEIDFLKIDAEGAEGDIIAGADWQRYRPRLLIIEATKPWSSELNCADWEPYLFSQGYLFTYFDGINRFYLRHEDAALAGQFAAPVNLLDNYISHEELKVRQELKTHLDAQQAKPPGITLTR